MQPASRKLILALLLGLILGHAGLSVHAATHAGDTGKCQLCGSSGAAAAVAAPAGHTFDVTAPLVPAPTVAASFAAAHRVATRQRGPPVAD